MTLQNPKAVRSRAVDPPISAVPSDAFLVVGIATGTWATHENTIAQWNGASWDYTSPAVGDSVFCEAENRALFWNGTAWLPTTAALSAALGANVTAQAAAVAAQATADGAVTALDDSRAPGNAAVLSQIHTGGFQGIEDTAYWYYQGYVAKATTIKFVRTHVITGGTGAQTAEVALASSPTAPNRGNLVLTKIAANATLTDLTGTGLMANTVSMAAAIPAGTHLWAGVRTAMATNEPIWLAVANDFGQGLILATAAAGALTGAGPWTGAVIAQDITAQAPQILATKD